MVFICFGRGEFVVACDFSSVLVACLEILDELLCLITIGFDHVLQEEFPCLVAGANHWPRGHIPEAELLTDLMKNMSSTQLRAISRLRKMSGVNLNPRILKPRP